jgi:hypothetical protein
MTVVVDHVNAVNLLFFDANVPPGGAQADSVPADRGVTQARRDLGAPCDDRCCDNRLGFAVPGCGLCGAAEDKRFAWRVGQAAIPSTPLLLPVTSC